MSVKAKRLLLVYVTAALMSLSVLSAVLYERCEMYRRATLYSSGAAFETAVKAADDISAALRKSLYATDSAMCAKLSCEIYADALAAEAALTALPFDTFELERMAGFINTAGDYAYMLCSASAEQGFTTEQAEVLHAMSDTALGLSQSLRELQNNINNGDFVMDERLRRLYNVGESGAGKLSEALLGLEHDLPRSEPLSYDGRYTAKQEKTAQETDEAQLQALAANAAGVDARELRLEYDYEHGSPRRCYSVGDRVIIVGASGLESIGCSRLVSEVNLSAEQARAAAESFLGEQGFENMSFCGGTERGGLMEMIFASREDDALCTDNTVSVTVALDTGGIYALNALNYSRDRQEHIWNITAEEAEKKLPAQVEPTDCEKVVIRSEGGRDIPCYKFSCTGEDGELKIYVDAEHGRQCRIEL